jgi:hypothetical protein
MDTLFDMGTVLFLGVVLGAAIAFYVLVKWASAHQIREPFLDELERTESRLLERINEQQAEIDELRSEIGELQGDEYFDAEDD